MERKNIVSKFFDIPLPGVAILAIISSLSLLIIFSNGFDEVPLSRVFYTISAYTLSVICFKAGRVLRKAIKKNSIMQSGERAVFSPHFLPLLHKTGRSFLYGRY